MMGSKERDFALLVNVSLEELVPQDHFYRHLERTLDLSVVRELVPQTSAGAGHPSIDPVVFFKLQLVMFFEGIRSQRQLMRHAADRLSVRWYIGYDLNESLPDHSSLTRIRERSGLDVFRRFFDAIVEHCQQEKLIWGKELSIESTQVNANTDLDSLTPCFAVEAREAMQAHLDALFTREDAQIGQQPALADHAEMPEGEAVATAAKTCPEPPSLPVPLTEAAQEELAQENAGRHDWISEEGRPQRARAWLLSAHLRPAHQHHRSGCHADAPQRGRHVRGVPYPLRRRWRQSACHSPGAGNPFGGDGEPTHA
ncbi:MAG: transposase [Ktedonobacteraceae bacterium]